MANLLKINKQNLKWQVFLIAIIVISSVCFIRQMHFNPVSIGYESYYHQRIAQDFSVNPFHLLIAGLSLVLGMDYVVLILPIIVALLMLWFLLTLLQELKFETREKFFICLFFILSPIFILLSITLSVYFFSLMLALAGLVLFFRHQVRWATVLFVIVALSSFYSGLALAVFLLLYYLHKNNRDYSYQ